MVKTKKNNFFKYLLTIMFFTIFISGISIEMPNKLRQSKKKKKNSINVYT